MRIQSSSRTDVTIQGRLGRAVNGTFSMKRKEMALEEDEQQELGEMETLAW